MAFAFHCGAVCLCLSLLHHARAADNFPALGLVQHRAGHQRPRVAFVNSMVQHSLRKGTASRPFSDTKRVKAMTKLNAIFPHDADVPYEEMVGVTVAHGPKMHGVDYKPESQAQHLNCIALDQISNGLSVDDGWNSDPVNGFIKLSFNNFAALATGNMKLADSGFKHNRQKFLDGTYDFVIVPGDGDFMRMFKRDEGHSSNGEGEYYDHTSMLYGQEYQWEMTGEPLIKYLGKFVMKDDKMLYWSNQGDTFGLLQAHEEYYPVVSERLHLDSTYFRPAGMDCLFKPKNQKKDDNTLEIAGLPLCDAPPASFQDVHTTPTADYFAESMWIMAAAFMISYGFCGMIGFLAGALYALHTRKK